MGVLSTAIGHTHFAFVRPVRSCIEKSNYWRKKKDKKAPTTQLTVAGHKDGASPGALVHGTVSSVAELHSDYKEISDYYLTSLSLLFLEVLNVRRSRGMLRSGICWGSTGFCKGFTVLTKVYIGCFAVRDPLSVGSLPIY